MHALSVRIMCHSHRTVSMCCDTCYKYPQSRMGICSLSTWVHPTLALTLRPVLPTYWRPLSAGATCRGSLAVTLTHGSVHPLDNVLSESFAVCRDSYLRRCRGWRVEVPTSSVVVWDGLVHVPPPPPPPPINLKLPRGQSVPAVNPHTLFNVSCLVSDKMKLNANFKFPVQLTHIYIIFLYKRIC